jgi:hypothetical protein
VGLSAFGDDDYPYGSPGYIGPGPDGAKPLFQSYEILRGKAKKQHGEERDTNPWRSFPQERYRDYSNGSSAGGSLRGEDPELRRMRLMDKLRYGDIPPETTPDQLKEFMREAYYQAGASSYETTGIMDKLHAFYPPFSQVQKTFPFLKENPKTDEKIARALWGLRMANQREPLPIKDLEVLMTLPRSDLKAILQDPRSRGYFGFFARNLLLIEYEGKYGEALETVSLDSLLGEAPYSPGLTRKVANEILHIAPPTEGFEQRLKEFLGRVSFLRFGLDQDMMDDLVAILPKASLTKMLEENALHFTEADRNTLRIKMTIAERGLHTLEMRRALAMAAKKGAEYLPVNLPLATDLTRALGENWETVLPVRKKNLENGDPKMRKLADRIIHTDAPYPEVRVVDLVKVLELPHVASRISASSLRPYLRFLLMQ